MGGSETERPRPLNQWGFWMLPPMVSVACRLFLEGIFASAQVKMATGLQVCSQVTEVQEKALNAVAWAGSGSVVYQIPEIKALINQLV